MSNHLTLSEHLAGPYQNEMTRYLAIVADVKSYLDSFPTTLLTVTRPIFDEMVKGEFSQVVALLPYWLSDLLPLPNKVIHKLGVAHLFGWWYYEVQDKLLDEETTSTSLLGAHLALLKMVLLYQELGVTDSRCWAQWEKSTFVSAECYAIERQTRFSSLEELKSEQVIPWTTDFIIKRASPFYFNTQAQLYLAGIEPNNPLHEQLVNALRYFAAARQIGDDANDWLDDLRTGRLNYVSARLITHLHKKGVVAFNGDLQFDYLTGYQLTDESFWQEIEEVNQNLSKKALEELESYSSCHLSTLIKRQMIKHNKLWEALRTQRAIFLELFGVEV